MKDYNFLISDDRLHKSGLTKTLLIKSGVGAKGGLEQFWNMRGWGGLAKETGDVFKGGGFICWYPLCSVNIHPLHKKIFHESNMKA